MAVLRLKPAYKDFLWGGSRLKKEYGKSEYHGYVLAETWEISCDPEGLTTIRNGPYKGRTFEEYVEAEGQKAMGTRFERFDGFPFSVKLIDAHQNLSIKLHPKVEYAAEHGLVQGNDECWYILDALPNAGIFCGVDRELNKEEFASMIEQNTLKQVLHFKEVHPGEVYYLGPGILHSIGAGVLVMDIKQRLQVKYRVYDFGRVQPDGTPRKLSIEEAVDSAILTPGCPTPDPEGHLVKCHSFTLDKIELSGEVNMELDGSTFHYLLDIDGDGILVSGDSRTEFVKGDSLFISADQGSYKLKGKGTLLLATI